MILYNISSTSGAYFLNSFNIVFALNMNIPLFHVNLLSLINFSANSNLGFSVNSIIFSPDIFLH